MASFTSDRAVSVLGMTQRSLGRADVHRLVASHLAYGSIRAAIADLALVQEILREHPRVRRFEAHVVLVALALEFVISSTVDSSTSQKASAILHNGIEAASIVLKSIEDNLLACERT
jgi:hypothetical protein